jgi:protein SCO1/2
VRGCIILSFILASAAAVAAGCSGPDRREYTLQGQILSVRADGMEANIKHEDIKDLMPAMTMPYKVRDSKELANLKPGDLITSTLVIVSNDAYLQDVRRVGEAPIAEAAPPSAPASSGFELLRPGDAVPNAGFVDQDGRARDFASFRKAPVLVTFIYTQCPLPTFCPLMDRHFKAIQDKIATDPALERVQLVSVSFDPITDTPPVLKEHARRIGADPRRWTFLTGDRDEVDKFAMRFGVSVTRNLTDPKDIAHNLRTVIVDEAGALVKAYTGNEWTPEQVLADLRTVAASD